jgi:hypothetical protein
MFAAPRRQPQDSGIMQPRRVATYVRPTISLAQAEWDEIWALTDGFYDAERAYAENELRKHQSIALFRSDYGELVGCVSLDNYTTQFRGREIAVIYTSHVLLLEAYRGQNILQKLGLASFLRMRARHPFMPIYWFYDTFSYKSYLLLPRNFSTFWPRHDQKTPEYESALIDQLASQMYGPAWRPARGIAVRSGQKRLRAGVAPLEPSARSDADLAFYTATNPGHAEGDMLVCLCPLTLGNWLALARKAFARLRRRRAD